MTQLVLGAVGAVIGGYFGGPAGASAGWAIGSGVGAVIDPAEIQGPRLKNFSPPTVEYGWPIPRIYGTRRVETWRAWQSELIETENQSGKGEPSVTTFTYKVHVLQLVCEIGPEQLFQVWINKKLAATFSSDSPMDSVLASQSSDKFDSITFLPGNVDQQPWPLYEAAVGIDTASAYIGRVTVGIEGLALEGGAVPLVEVIVCTGPQTLDSFEAVHYETHNLGNRVRSPGSPAWQDSPISVPLKVPDRVQSTSGYDGTTNWRTQAEAIQRGVITAPAFIVSTGEELVDVDTVAVRTSSVQLDGGTTDTYRVYGVIRVIATDEEEVQFYEFQVLYDSPLMDFRVADEVAGQYVSLPVSFDSSNTFVANQPAISRGTSDAPMVGVIANQNISSVDHYYMRGSVGSDGVDYEIGGASTSGVRYVLRDGVLWISQGANPFTVRRFTVGTSAHTAETVGISGTCSGLACDGVTLFVYIGSIKRYDATTLMSSGADITPPVGVEHIFCDSGGSLYSYGNQLLHRYDAGTWTEVLDVTGSDFDGGDMLHPPAFEAGVLHAIQTTSSGAGMDAWAIIRSVAVVEPQASDVNTILIAELARCGIHTGLLDLTDTDDIPVLGIDITASARNVAELLGAAFYFDTGCDAELFTKLRGSSSVRTIPYSDMGAGVDQAKEEALEITRANDIEVPPRFALTVYNPLADHANLTVYDDRQVSQSPEVRQVSLPIVFEPDQAKGIVNTMAADARVTATTFKVCLTDYHCQLRLGDVVTLTARSGSTFRARLVAESYYQGVREFEAALDDAGILQELGITDEEFEPTLTILTSGWADLILLDIPELQSDNVAGLYVAGDMRGGAREMRVYRSTDDVTFEPLLSVTSDVVFGTAITTLRDWDGRYIWDAYSTVDVRLTGGTLSASTEAAMQADRSINLAVIGDEVVRFQSASLIGTDTYRLSNMIRVSHGTERHGPGHSVGDRFVLLTTTALQSMAQAGAETGVTRYWKGVAIGRRLDAVTSQAHELESVRAKPLSPVRLHCTRDGSENAVISFDRRTRHPTRYGGATGSLLPLGEQSERYEVDIYADTGFVQFLKTIVSLTSEVPYSAADQTADGITPGDPLNVRAYQISASVGRGYALEGSV